MLPPLDDLPPYYRHVRPEILHAVPPDAFRILDLGCAAGLLGKLLKLKDPRRYVVGVELHEVACRYAEVHLDQVYQANLETLEPPFQVGEFDCLICADVLEHLVDPWKVARTYSQFLKPGGTIVASIPNIRYLGILQDLAAGIWQYQEEGILDRTHLRFFTRESFLELLAQADIACQSVTCLVNPAWNEVAPQGADRRVQLANLVLTQVSDQDFAELAAMQLLFVGQYTPRHLKSVTASVIVPWWDHTELLEFWHTNMKYLSDAEVIFIDNGSAPEGEAALASFCQQYGVRLIRNDRNRGFAAANNQGAAIAQGEYLLFLNNDVQVLQPPVQTLCRLAGQGIAGPFHAFSDWDDGYVAGWALCIARSAFEQIGGWGEEFGLGFWEDIDLCRRAKLAGFLLRYSPDLTEADPNQPSYANVTGITSERPLICHIGSQTIADGRISVDQLFSRNRVIYARKVYPQLQPVNVMLIPDWQQSEETLQTDLQQSLLALLNHPDRAQIALLIDNRKIAEEDLNLLLTAVVLDLCWSDRELLLEDLPLLWLSQFSQIDQGILLRAMHARLACRYEDQSVIEEAGISQLPQLTPDAFQRKRVVAVDDQLWVLR